MNKKFTEIEAAEFLCHKPQTLSNWRHLRKGPPYVKLSRRIFYLESDLIKFINKNRIDHEKKMRGLR